jgi:hypothetical protein
MATLIVFAVPGKERPATLTVDAPPRTVAGALHTGAKLVPLERGGDAGTVWINPAQVLYVADASEPFAF